MVSTVPCIASLMLRSWACCPANYLYWPTNRRKDRNDIRTYFWPVGFGHGTQDPAMPNAHYCIHEYDYYVEYTSYPPHVSRISKIKLSCTPHFARGLLVLDVGRTHACRMSSLKAIGKLRSMRTSLQSTSQKATDSTSSGVMNQPNVSRRSAIYYTICLI
jgi:hypothetical protein